MRCRRGKPSSSDWTKGIIHLCHWAIVMSHQSHGPAAKRFLVGYRQMDTGLAVDPRLNRNHAPVAVPGAIAQVKVVQNTKQALAMGSLAGTANEGALHLNSTLVVRQELPRTDLSTVPARIPVSRFETFKSTQMPALKMPTGNQRYRN